MYYGEDDDFTANSPSKTIKVYRNGDHTQSFDLKLASEIKPRDVLETIETKLKLTNIQRLRLFTIEGLEVTPEELAYLKSGEAIFASKGENFDKSSTLAEYEIIKPLGEGGFGEVVLAIHKRSQEQVAIKFLKASTRIMANEVNKLFAEAETLKNLHHKNIVHVINCFSLSTMQVAFVMEYLDGGELLQYVLKRGKLAEEEALEFFQQIAGAVAYCHRNKLIHCDLKLENILLQSKESKVVKVVDFGISGLCTGTHNDADGGSLDYMPPEYFNGSKKGVHPGVDVWALGCMLYGMVCGKLPFGDTSEAKIIDRICHARYDYDEAGKKLSREVRNLIARMLEPDTEQRLNIHDVLDHPWVNNQKLPDAPEEEMKNESEKKATTTQNVPIQARKTAAASSTKSYSSTPKAANSPMGKKTTGPVIEKSPKAITLSSVPQVKKGEINKSGKKI